MSAAEVLATIAVGIWLSAGSAHLCGFALCGGMARLCLRRVHLVVPTNVRHGHRHVYLQK